VAQSTVKLIVDAQNAIRPLQRVNEQTKALSSSTDKLKGRLDKSNRSLKNTGTSARTASTGVKSLVGALRPLLAALAVVGSARFVLFQTAQLETQTKALEVLTGSAEKAQDIVQEIKEFGAVTPFKSSELIEVAKRMKAFGFETENVVDITKRIADIAGTAGADIDGVALAIGKVQAKNKFMQEENIMLLEKGINVTKDLEEITGLTGEALADAMSKGEIGADKFVEAIVKATSKNGQFFEGASKQSDTLAGKFSTFVDNVETFAQNLGKMFEDPLKFILDELNKIASEFNKIFALLTDANIGASNKAVGSAAFKARFGMQEDAVADITKAVNLLDPSFVKTEQDAAKLFAQLDRISKVMTLVKGPDSATVLEGRGLLGPLIEASNQMDDIRDKVNANLKAQKQGTIQTEKNKEQVKETALTFTELISSSDFFNTNLDLSGIFLNKINNGTDELSESFNTIKTDAELLKEKFAEIGHTIGSQISDALVGAINGTKSLGEAAKNIINDLANSLLRLGINTLLKSTGFGIFSNLPGFANGGRPPVNKPSIVGERGPELFTPSVSGTITPNHALGGGTNVVVNVDASGSSVEGDEDRGRELGRLISVAVQSELVQQKRPGGLLA
jgi:hypothetical protein